MAQERPQNILESPQSHDASPQRHDLLSEISLRRRSPQRHDLVAGPPGVSPHNVMIDPNPSELRLTGSGEQWNSKPYMDAPYAKRSIHDGSKVKIAPVHPDFVVALGHCP